MAGRTLSYYLEAFENMNRAVMRGISAPHKPLLLLAILNLVQYHHVTSHHILLSKELVTEFKRLWLFYIGNQEGNDVIMVAEGLMMDVPKSYPFKCSIENPFYHMQHEPFWKLIRNSDAPFLRTNFFLGHSHKHRLFLHYDNNSRIRFRIYRLFHVVLLL